MITETILSTTETTVTLGTTINTSTKDVQSGLYTIETGAGTGTPTITLYGKLIASLDPEVDSGWVELAESASTAAGTVTGGSVSMYPYMTATVTGNSGGLDIHVAIAYSNRGG